MLLLWACMLAHDGQPHGQGQREADREGGTPFGERACPPLCNVAAAACACLAAFPSKHYLRLWHAVKLTHDCVKYEGKVWRDHWYWSAFPGDRCVASRFRTIIQHAAASGADAAAPRSGTCRLRNTPPLKSCFRHLWTDTWCQGATATGSAFSAMQGLCQQRSTAPFKQAASRATRWVAQ